MRYFFNFSFGIVLTMCGIPAQAQNYPVFNNYYINPFLYNPAEAINEHTQVYAVHRQQWLNVEGAPKLSAITFNTLLNDTRAGVGAKFSTYSRGLLKTTDISLTYAYGIPVGKKNWFIFGMSGGAISNQVDVDNISPNTDPDDPAISAYLANNLQPAANAGILLRSVSGLNLGVSFPQLFNPVFNSESSFGGTKFSPMDNIFVSLYYRRKTESKIVSRRKKHIHRKIKTDEGVAPLEFYANYKYSKFGNSQVEFTGKLNLAQHFWVGATYKLSYGFAANIGIMTSRFTMGYSFEPGSQPEEGFSQGTHEVIVGLRLGNIKKFKRHAPAVLRSTLSTTEEKHIARFQETVEDPDAVSDAEKKDVKVYYVVIRSFPDFSQADAYKQKLRGEKFNADVFYNPADKKFHVHVLKTSKAAEANEEVKNLKSFTKLKDARLMTVTERK
jgi:type IX secretion system PorP/SprF family membrane protein